MAVLPRPTMMLAAAVLASMPAAAQPLTISEARQDCIPRLPYPVLAAGVEPASRVGAVWLHFRAAESPDFYWLRMKPVESRFAAILPVPARETLEIVYFVVAVGSEGEVVRTEPYRARVVDNEEGCDDLAATFRGKPQIVVGGPPGVPAVPPGFDPSGIAGTVAQRHGSDLLPWLASFGLVGFVIALDENESVSPSFP